MVNKLLQLIKQKHRYSEFVKNDNI